jgi:hypothetical protein
MRKHGNRFLAIAAATLAALLAAAPSSANYHAPNFAGYQTGNKNVLVGFYFHAKGCPGPECLDHRPKVLSFNVVGYLYPGCPQLIDGVTEYDNPVVVGRNGSFEASGPGSYAGEKISFGGRFLDQGRRARGWVLVDNGGCLSERIHWTASPE